MPRFIFHPLLYFFLVLLFVSNVVQAGGEYKVLRVEEDVSPKHKTENYLSRQEEKARCQQWVDFLNQLGDDDIFLCELPLGSDLPLATEPSQKAVDLIAEKEVFPAGVDALDWELLDWDEARAREFLQKSQENINKLDLEATEFPSFQGSGFVFEGKSPYREIEILAWKKLQEIHLKQLKLMNLEFDYAFQRGRNAWSVRRLDVTNNSLPFRHLLRGNQETLVLYSFFIHYDYCKIRRLDDDILKDLADAPNESDHYRRTLDLQLASEDGCPFHQFTAYEWQRFDNNPAKKDRRIIKITDFIRNMSGLVLSEGINSRPSLKQNSNLEIGEAWLHSDHTEPLPVPDSGIYEVRRAGGMSTPFSIDGQWHVYNSRNFIRRLGFGELYFDTLAEFVKKGTTLKGKYKKYLSENEKWRENINKWPEWDRRRYNDIDTNKVREEKGPLYYSTSSASFLMQSVFTLFSPVDYWPDSNDLPFITAWHRPICNISYHSNDPFFGIE